MQSSSQSPSMPSLSQSQEKAKLIRKWCLISTTEAASGHPTSCLSAADIATVLFDKYFSYDLNNPLNLFNDRIVLSKGHAAPLLYALFGVAGAYPLEELKTLRKFGSVFEGHPVPKFKYAEAATGSLGQGLSVGAGLAIIGKRESLPFKTFVICGDGELAEGQIWEAANFASHNELDNLIAILDINRLAQSGETMFGHHMQEYADRFQAFGFQVTVIDGHNYDEIDKALDVAVNNKSGKPFAIIAKTLKGKGVSFVENKEGWHGKPLKKDELEKALKEIGSVSDDLRFNLKKPMGSRLPDESPLKTDIDISFDKGKEIATREVYGQVLAKLGEKNKSIYALDADVKNSTFSEDFLKVLPNNFIECFIAEQNMVSAGVGISRLERIPFISTFAAFLTRAADQIRMSRVSEANIKFTGSHVGVSIGEDGPSQMGLEDIAMFSSIPDSVVLQPSDAYSTAKLLPQMMSYKGLSYMRTLRPKTPLLYSKDDQFPIGSSKILKQSDRDELTVVATGITVFEALKAYDELQKQGITVRVIDCYSIKPMDQTTLVSCLNETKQRIIITVEDHYEHGGMGDAVLSSLADANVEANVEKMAVTKVSQSGTKDQLLDDAGINFSHIISKVKQLVAQSETVS